MEVGRSHCKAKWSEIQGERGGKGVKEFNGRNKKKNGKGLIPDVCGLQKETGKPGSGEEWGQS